MITYYKKTIHGDKLKKLKRFETGCWINVVDPTEEEINFLVQRFGIDKQNILSGLDENEVPRVEFERDKVYIIVKTVYPERPYLQTLLILLTNNFILTLSKRQPTFIDNILTASNIITTQKYKTLIIFLSKINKEFEEEIRKTLKVVNTLAVSSKKINEKNIYALLQHEEKLNFYIFSYQYTKPIFEKLIKKLNFYEADKDIIEDLVINSEEGLNLCKSSLKTISNLRKYYDVMMSTRINKAITVLTLFTIFLSVLTAISGFYGMNVILPFQNLPNISIYLLIFSMFLGGSVLIFVKLKWL